MRLWNDSPNLNGNTFDWISKNETNGQRGKLEVQWENSERGETIQVERKCEQRNQIFVLNSQFLSKKADKWSENRKKRCWEECKFSSCVKKREQQAPNLETSWRERWYANLDINRKYLINIQAETLRGKNEKNNLISAVKMHGMFTVSSQKWNLLERSKRDSSRPEMQLYVKVSFAAHAVAGVSF